MPQNDPRSAAVADAVDRLMQAGPDHIIVIADFKGDHPNEADLRVSTIPSEGHDDCHVEMIEVALHALHERRGDTEGGPANA